MRIKNINTRICNVNIQEIDVLNSTHRKITVNGVVILIPNYVNSNKILFKDGRLFVGSHEYVGGTWIKSFTAIINNYIKFWQ